MAKTQADIYKEVTDTLVDSLRKGIIPWKRPFTVEGGLHRSFSTHKPYRGGNQFYLDMIALSKGYKSPFWITMNQIKKNEGKLIKINKPEEKGTGQKSSIVFFYKPLFIEEENDKGEKEKRFIPLLKYFTVFNLDQVEGIEAPELEADDYTPLERAGSIVKNMPEQPTINPTDKDGSDASFDYDPATDAVSTPNPNYPYLDEQYRSMFRVLVESTGHSKRLNRKAEYAADPAFSKENLIGEMGAAMLSGLCDLNIPEGKVDQRYIDGWIKRFEDNERLAVQAASKAQGAADYIVGAYDDEDEDDE